MAAVDNESNIVVPFLPTLSHFAAVRVAVSLYNNFGKLRLGKYFRESRDGNSIKLTKFYGNLGNGIRTKRNIEFIPIFLRKRVLEAINGLHETYKMRYCMEGEDHPMIFKSNGSADYIKSIQQVVLDKRININKRFRLACKYCLVEPIKNLWLEIEASGLAEDFELDVNPVARFWVRWFEEGSPVPWTQAAVEYLHPPSSFHLKYSCFFPLLDEKHRRKFLERMLFEIKYDDVQLCLSSLSKEEQENVLNENVGVFLAAHLYWPLQCIFLETAKRVWDHVSDDEFQFLLRVIFYFKKHYHGYNYCELLEGFWNMGSDQYKQSAGEDLHVKIDSYFNEKRRKRKLSEGGQKNKKMNLRMVDS